MKQLISLGFVLCLLMFGVPSMTFAAPSTRYATPAGAGDKTGSSWANAMGAAELYAELNGNNEAGDIFYVYTGTYTATANTLIVGGTLAAGVQIIGISDQDAMTYAEGTDRPLFACGAYRFYVRTYTRVENIQVTTTYASGTEFISAAPTLAINCKFTGVRGASGVGSGAVQIVFIKCEFVSTSTYGLVWGVAINCTASGVSGFYGCVVINSIFTGGTGSAFVNNYISVNNTVVEGVSGIYVTAASGVFMNTIFEGNTNIMNTTVDCDKSMFFIDYNDYYDNTNGFIINSVSTPAFAGSNDITLNPNFVDAANDDYRVGANLRSKGLGTFGSGLSANCVSAVDIGAVQITEVLPAITDVADGVFYGANGTELEGTLEATGGSSCAYVTFE